jgi:(p)ppGpp synthase/HD superfamily hydrolase
VRLPFASVAVEARRKLDSMCAPGDERPLLELVDARLGRAAVEDAQRAVDFALSLQSHDAHHASVRAYFSHPLRVATFALALDDEPAVETVQLGVLHNVFEICGLTERDLVAAGLPARVADGIRLLTIDRKRERDREYLTGFYARIEAFGRRLALIRTVDKLDNLLGLQLLDEGDVRQSYLELGHAFVGPIAHRLSPSIGAYFHDVAVFMRTAGVDREAQARYQAFNRR